MLKLLRQTTQLAVFVNRRRADTFGPSGFRHGSVTSTGLYASMWARMVSATDGGSGASRSLLHLGGAKHGLAPDEPHLADHTQVGAVEVERVLSESDDLSLTESVPSANVHHGPVALGKRRTDRKHCEDSQRDNTAWLGRRRTDGLRRAL
ncbi:hypothetical protein [Streptomyces ferrugineus]|uniref:hypothetical protein n=1 Tax=Streptomyces ferrugineus TaxID=1413221 RepID=UPI00389AA8E2